LSLGRATRSVTADSSKNTVTAPTDAAYSLAAAVPSVVWMLASATWSLDGVASITLAPSSEILPPHLRNGILQVWLELGGNGVALSFAPLMLMIRHAFRLPAWRCRLVQALIAGTVAAAAAVGLVSFGIWQEWFISGLFVTAAVVVLAARQSAASASGVASSDKRRGRA